MKIILTNQAHPNFGGPGGAERSVKSLAEGLVARGHEVISLSMAPKDMIGHLTMSGIHSEHRIAGVRTILLGKVSKSATEVEMMASVIERERPDVVHTNTFWHNADLWREVSALNVPIVHSLREYKLLCTDNMYKDGAVCDQLCERCGLRAKVNQARSQLVSGLVGISRYTLDRHLQFGFFEGVDDRTVIHNSVTGARRAIELEPGQGPLRLGFLGRLHPTKGIDRLIEAVLARPDQRVHLTVAGELQDEGVSQQLLQAQGDPRLEYLGFVEPEELFRRIDVLVVPSAWPEPFGRIVVEAYMMGIPVLAAASGGLPELVVEGKTGWTYPNTAEGLAKAIEMLASDPKAPALLRESCVEAAGQYEPAAIAAEYEAVYQRAVARKTSGKVAKLPTERAARRLFSWPPRSQKAESPGADNPKVLVITGEFPKLSETFVLNHITGMIDAGLDVTVYAERPGGDDQWHDDVDKYRLMEKCVWYGVPNSLKGARDYLSETSKTVQKELHALLDEATLVGTPPPLDSLARALLDEQLRLDSRLRLFNAAGALIRSGKQFDIAHAHFGHRGLFAAELKRMGVLDAKIAVSFHGIDLTEHVRRAGTGVYDRLLDSGDLLLPISNFFRERLLKLGFSPRRTLVHHVGVDVDKFRFKARTSGKDEVVRVLTVGRLVPKKGVDYALRALASLKKRGKLGQFHYDIVGDGPEREALVKLRDKLELGKYVNFHGSQSHQQIAEWMQKSQIMLAPSVTASNGDMEGIPTTIMEAMASGMPVVSTRHSGIAELVDDGVTGMLCPERDFEKLADALSFLQQNRELWAEFGTAGRKVVEQDFNIARQNEKLTRYYRELAGLHAPSKLKRAV